MRYEDMIAPLPGGIRRGRLLFTGYLSLGLSGVVLAGIEAGPGERGFGPDFFALGFGLLLAGLSLTIGGVIGFLFALPRGLASAPEVRSAANLEIIADWLAKMLVGAFLVSIPNIPSLWQGFVAASDLDPAGPHGNADRLGALISLYFFLGGFLGIYFLTRLQVWSVSVRLTSFDEGFKIALDMPLVSAHRAPLSLDALQALDKFAAAPKRELRSDTELRAWAKAQAIGSAGDLAGAIEAYETLISGSSDPSLLLEFAELLDRAGEKERAKEYRNSVTHSSESSDQSPDLILQRMFAALYRPGGYLEAIDLGEPLTLRVRDARLWVYLTCAYGQMHAALRAKKNPSQKDIDQARGRALYCLKQVMAEDPQWRATLRALWDPNAVRPGDDNDLVSLYDDTDFRAILDPESLATTQAGSLAGEIRSGIESALSGQSLTKFDGYVETQLASIEGIALARDPESGAWQATPGQPGRVVIRIVPGAVPDESDCDSLPLSIPGEERPQVQFELRPDASEVDFATSLVTVTMSGTTASSELELSFKAPEEPGTYHLWIDISQARRTVQIVEAALEVAKPPRSRSTRRSGRR